MSNQIFLILLLAALCNCDMIYRRYEKQHPRKNYVQVVEIFGTIQRPPPFIKGEKELNDFLGRDAFKSDMNCTRDDTTTQATTTTLPVTLTQTTSTPRHSLSTTPNLDQLFTFKPTRATIRPNPKENANPDYTELYNWATPNVQVTKHRPSTNTPPLIFIKETDTRVSPVTSAKPVKVETTTEATKYDPDYDENGNNNINNEDDYDDNEDYNPNNYDIIEDDNINENVEYVQSDDENSEEFDFEAMRRRKRLIDLRRKRLAQRQKIYYDIGKV